MWLAGWTVVLLKNFADDSEAAALEISEWSYESQVHILGYCAVSKIANILQQDSIFDIEMAKGFHI